LVGMLGLVYVVAFAAVSGAAVGRIEGDCARAEALAARTIRSAHHSAPGRRYPSVTCAEFYQPFALSPQP
jgi:hypothetical protein